jgi:hypothetical protein
MKLLLTSVLVILASVAQAQADTSIFKDIKKVEMMEYLFTVPQRWRKIDPVDNATKDKKFDFSGVGLPDIYKSTPLTATFTLRVHNCDSIQPAVDFAINELTSYPDRLTPPGKNYSRDSMTIASGDTGVLLGTDYYRRSKSANYTIYELILYSKKRKAAYILNVTYQYRDSAYTAAADLRLKQYALRIFQNLILR